MAKAPVFKDSNLEVRASGWKVGHRAPACGYGQLDGIALASGSYENVSKEELARNDNVDIRRSRAVDGDE